MQRLEMNQGSEPANVILVFGAHLDDEVIGAGGFLALESLRGAKVIVVTLSENQTAFPPESSSDEVSRAIHSEAKAASSILGITERVTLGLESNSISHRAETYKDCVKLIRRYKPNMILTHKGDDKHRDHRVVSSMVQEAAWKASQNVLGNLGEPWFTEKLYMFEVLELFSRPSAVVDVTLTFQRKLDAMKAYVSQVEVIPNVLDFIEALARVRGFLIGTRYGEAYEESHILPRRSL